MKTRFFKERVLPINPAPDAVYFIYDGVGELAEAYVTDVSGIPKRIGGDGDVHKDVQNYRSSLENGYIYSGYLIEGQPEITRCQNGTREIAMLIANDLETDWLNRQSLSYN